MIIHFINTVLKAAALIQLYKIYPSLVYVTGFVTEGSSTILNLATHY